MTAQLFRCTLLALLIAFSGLHWSPARAAEFDHAALSRLVLENHIRPGYSKLYDAARALARANEALCKKPDENLRQATRAAFVAMVRAWGRIEHVRFGPVTEGYAHERIAFWPDPKGVGARQVRRILKKRTPEVLEPAALAKKSVAVQGLTALEIVFFAKGNEAVGQDSESGRFRCGYGLAIARNLERITGTLVADWSADGEYSALWLNPGSDNPVYLTGKEVTRDSARALLDGLEALREHKIAGPIGLRPDGAARTRAAFRRSDLAIAFIHSNSEGLLDLFATGGFADMFRGRAPGLVDNILGELKRVQDLAAAIEATGITDIRTEELMDQFLVMGFPLKNARERAAELIVDVSGLVIRFNDSDAN